jgi:hypothetical protein
MLTAPADISELEVHAVVKRLNPDGTYRSEDLGRVAYHSTNPLKMFVWRLTQLVRKLGGN